MKKDFYSKKPQPIRGNEIKATEFLKPPTPLRETRSTKKAEKFYSSATWIKTRDQKRRSDPVCELCKFKGILSPVRYIHHITPLDEDGEALDQDNLMSICSESEHRKLHLMINNDKKIGIKKWERKDVIQRFGEM